MSRKRRKGAKATAASMVMDTLKKRGAFYYDDLGFKALETKFVRGYSMIFIVPIVIAILVYVLQKVLS